MSRIASVVLHPDRYRRALVNCDAEFGAALDDLAASLPDAPSRLRYLHSAFDSHIRHKRYVALLPLPTLRRVLYRWLGLEALADFISASKQNHLPIIRARNHARWSVAAVVIAGLLAVIVVLVGMSMMIVRPAISLRTGTHATMPLVATAKNAVVPSADAAVISQPERVAAPIAVAESLAEEKPEENLGVQPASIWLADRGPGWELYSNGLRIETTDVVQGRPRQFQIHTLRHDAPTEIFTRPVGILFHISESDLWPLEPDFSARLRSSSTALRHYLQRAAAYNYLIDRFGRVFRIVADETAAAHAGNSIWARGDDIYVDLNSAFIGVAFESRWNGGQVLPITRAQLIAGRNLTNYLRQKFSIAPDMCVTHGLTSVNPRSHLIGYHRDWASGFPFAAFGLPDLYAQPTPSVALLGFGYDEDFLRALGTRWPGLERAEQQLRDEARDQKVSVAALRSDRQQLYDRWRKSGVNSAPSDAALEPAIKTRG